MKNRTRKIRARKAATQKKADKEWGRKILARDKTCRWPGCTQPSTDPHHIVHRWVKALRHRQQNGIGFCRTHHIYAHNHPEETLTLIDKETLDWLRNFKITGQDPDTPEEST